MTYPLAPKLSYRLAWLSGLVNLSIVALRFLERSAGPVVELLIRLTLAQGFFVSGVLKAAQWDNALYLAAHEYPVSWLNPVSAAWLGVLIELLGSVLLAAGLATRFAALALAALALVIQFSYQTLDTHLFWAALLLWFVVHGAGTLSLDRLLARGLARTAVPFAGVVLRLFADATHWLAPLYSLLLRWWLALAVLAAIADVAIATSNGGAMDLAALLPVTSAAVFASPLTLVGAALLALGCATRLAALLLMLAVSTVHMLGPGVEADPYWFMVLALMVLWGPGLVSLDALLERALRRRFPRLAGQPAFALDSVPRVVIVGAGFGGLTCAAALTSARVAVTVIDRHNYHLFQPLLYQVATSGLSPGDIATPVRGLFREHFNVRVLFGEVNGVDSVRQEVLMDGQRIAYDYLVLATGAAHSYFGRDDWAPHAPGLKRVEDATEVRRRLLTAFEQAEVTDDPAEQASLLTFLIVGGGPTGVELAGAIAELAKFGMEKDFRRFDPAAARVILVQSGPRLLPTFAEDLSQRTRQALERLGVEVLLDSRVESIDDRGVIVNGRPIAARTVLWAAGVVASPAAKWLGAEADPAGRVKVGPDLSVHGLPNVFAIGDTALANAWNGTPVPGLAPAAKQGGHHVARVIRARVEGRPAPAAFQYQHLGSLATIGRKAAVADFGFVKLHGGPAWWLWGAVHLGFLVGLRNRISVMLDWFWAYLTYRSGTRLITGGAGSQKTGQRCAVTALQRQGAA
ncbi:FAD-dependent oxidoreductase [Accumulibacter sp.]|uniref:FAD-dependent oxidoreductase n=1 Tax=Accumulibacter sp. TaxID=2053492 RepID=UPI00258A6CD9|nr:FAD-dependent oxidoreductase [Accumulibacter sp.]MCM8578474.1 FAD-dependent oxidoreductase [Accumulibacter sp.]HMW54446.1 FAD-dependent oxidoreductase [Accumulibacter sp.]